MAKGQSKNKNQQDRAEREAERRRRDEERARERQEREAEKAREREEREEREEDTQAEPPALVLASVQVFGQMPPHQLYVLTNGSTIATPDMDPTLVESVRLAIIGHFTPEEEEAPEEEIPVDPAPEDQTPEDLDEDGNAPEDYAALEGATEVSVNLTIPEGMDEDDITRALQQALTNITQKGGI